MSHPKKLSQSRKVATSGVVVDRRGRAKWVWGFCAFVLILGVFFSILWQSRYSLIENQVRKALAEMGVDADLEIVSLDLHKAVLGAVSLSTHDTQFFSAQTIELDYDYKQVRDGQFQRIFIRKPIVEIELDAQGNLVDGFINDLLPNPSDNVEKQAITFPTQGVFIDSGEVSWRAPFGHGVAHANVDVLSLHNWSANIRAPRTVLTQGDVSLLLEIETVFEQKNKAVFTAIGSMRTQGLETPVVQASTVVSDFDLEIKTTRPQVLDVQGWMRLSGAQLATERYEAGDMRLKLDIESRFHTDTSKFETIQIDWAMKGDGLAIRDAQARQQQARVLTGYEALSITPITTHFADDLPQKLDALLTGFSVYGSGQYVGSGEGYEVRLDDEFIIQAGFKQEEAQALRIKAGETPLIAYNNHTRDLILSADVDWAGARPVNVKNMRIQAVSETGFSIDEMQALSANISSGSEWRKRKHGQDFRISPFDIELNYQQKMGVRDVYVSGVLDYDGRVPGAYVRGLKAGGEITMRMQGDGFTLGYTPTAPLQIAKVQSASGWRGEDVTLTLEATPKLMYSMNTRRAMSVNIREIQAQLISPDDMRHLDLNMGSLHLKTVFGPEPQIWDFDIGNAHLKSDDFPSPGTNIFAASSQFQMRQTLDGDMQFSSHTPHTRIETHNIRISDMEVSLEGAPDDFTASYESEEIEFLGGDIPLLPMRGTARLHNGELSGQAMTDLPLTENTPIEVSFRSVDGQGTAEIDIPAIHFTPNGLQPQYLVRSLRGKLADVSGTVSANFNFAFGGGEPIRSFGTTTLVDLDIGTAVGPLTGVNSQLAFSSIFPLKTDGVQSASLASFNPGFAMENGAIRFEIVPGGVRIDEALWPIENIDGTAGSIFVEPMDWRFGNVVNTALVQIEDIDLGTLLAGIGKDKLSATGRVTGTLPVRVDGVRVLLENGKLEIKDGGVIRFQAPAMDRAGEVAATRNEYAGHAIKALENFTYKTLEARIDGPLDGTVRLNMVFDGENEEVLNAQPFLFNLGVEGELANIARNLSNAFSTQENLGRILAIQAQDGG